MGSIRNGGDQARIYHRSPDAEEKAAGQPVFEFAGDCGEKQACSLDPHSSNDQALASPSVAQRTRRHLENAPGCRVHGLENADTFDAKSKGSEEQREDAPAHAVIEIVDKSRLRCREEIAIAEGGESKHLPIAYCLTKRSRSSARAVSKYVALKTVFRSGVPLDCRSSLDTAKHPRADSDGITVSSGAHRQKEWR
jgi:hypothetical protein